MTRDNRVGRPPFCRLALCVAIIVTLDGAVAAPAARMTSIGNSAGHDGRQRTAGFTQASSRVVVANCHDAGSGSLRDALSNAVDEETIDLTQLRCSRITLTSGTLATPASAANIQIYGPSVRSGGVVAPGITIDAGGASRALTLLGTGLLSLNGLAVENGLVSSTGAKGGCIYSAGDLNISYSTVTGCHLHATGDSTGQGGGIYSADGVGLVLSSVSGNVATSDSGYTYGGGINARRGVFLYDSTVDGNTANGIGYGGGIATPYAYLHNSTVSNNVASYDGALELFGRGESRLYSSTISGNTAHGGIGGIQANGPLYTIDTTIAFNTSEATLNRASGVFMNASNQLTAYGTIIAKNTDGARAADVGGNGVIGSADLIMAADVGVPGDTISLDPLLGTLANNGGYTQTHALLVGSPAIDRGTSDIGIIYDQRGAGFPRQTGAAPDIGAYEVSPRLFAPTVAKAFSPVTIGADGISTLTITLANANDSDATLASPLTDNLPMPVLVATPSNAATTCLSGSVTATGGSGTVTLSGGSRIPATGSCTVTVSVTAGASGNFTNVIEAGGLQTDAGANTLAAIADIMVSQAVDDTIFADSFE